jgi:ATPase subunit of ABC transporter with duplicated ATPase domains
LTISHDRYFLDKLCTRTIEINGGIVRDFPGGFSYYQANQAKGTVLTLDMSPRPAAGKQARAGVR